MLKKDEARRTSPAAEAIAQALIAGNEDRYSRVFSFGRLSNGCLDAGRASGPGAISHLKAKAPGPHGGLPTGPLISWNRVKTFRRLGQSRNKKRALSCATTTASSLPMSIMRTSRGDYMCISMRSALGERTMLETPILIVIIVLVIAAVVWWLYR